MELHVTITSIVRAWTGFAAPCRLTAKRVIWSVESWPFWHHAYTRWTRANLLAEFHVSGACSSGRQQYS